MTLVTQAAVSYTHLDVYKRQAAARLFLKACVDIGKHEKLAQHVCDRLRIRHGDASVRVTINHAVNSIPRSGERCQTHTENDGKQYKLS